MDNRDVKGGARLFETYLSDPDKFPVRFIYAGKEYRGLPGARKMTAGGGNETRVTLTLRLDPTMTVKAEARLVRPYGQCEYTVWFENDGESPSAVLSTPRAPAMATSRATLGSWSPTISSSHLA